MKATTTIQRLTARAADSRNSAVTRRVAELRPIINQYQAGPSRFPIQASPRRALATSSAITLRQYATLASEEPLVDPVLPRIGPADSYDIVIIGGANAGLALACALLSKPSLSQTARILLLEGGSLDKTRSWDGKGEWENRVSSLTSENVAWLEITLNHVRLIQGIGAWQYIHEHRSCPVEEMIIWANPSPTSTPTIHFPPLDHPMARMTENMNLQNALLKRIETAGKGIVEIRENGRVSEMLYGPGDSYVALNVSGKWVKGALVIGADGPNSPVRHFSHIDTYGHSYPTHAVVATLRHPPPMIYPNNTAFQRFLPTGPLAFLPLSPTASTLVWSTRPHLAAALKKLSPEALTVMVNAGYSVPETTLEILHASLMSTDPSIFTPQHINNIIASQPLPSTPSSEQPILPPTVTSIPSTSIASFPLRLSHADVYLGPRGRTALVGDAAHTIHPLAGQGLNMGLADVRSIANALEVARTQGVDLGTEIALKPYPRERYPLNHLMLSTTDHLHQVFGSRNGLINWARGVGLDVINELGPLKKLLMGGAGAQPTVSEGSGVRHGGPGQSGSGWPGTMATGVEAMSGLKGVVGGVMGIVGGVAKSGLQRAVGAMSRGR